MKYWSLFSGGKDSTACTQYLEERGELAGVVSFDTGIAAPDWLPHIEKTVNERHWNLEIYKTPASYDALVLKYGFPGPGLHGLFMNYLKGRCVRLFKKAHKGEMLASGVRMMESERRFGGAKEWSLFEGVKVWAPIVNWKTPDVWAYVTRKGFERSPAYQTLCISGDCLCGAFATKMERATIRAFYPEVSERLSRLEAQTEREWGWAANAERIKKRSPLCVDCESKNLELWPEWNL
jgi:3'-phosphoadenosine 5'-phosphosulfate sulfotransferase (PAPS reductase)/FAD synthetase